MSKRRFTQVQSLLSEIQKMIEEGKTQQEIAEYFGLTNEYRRMQSISRKESPYNNAIAENFFFILETKCIYRYKPKPSYEENGLIDRYIYSCNHEHIWNKTGVAPLMLCHSD